MIGGLGPMATVYFLQLVTAMEKVSSDQEHMPIYMQSIPGTPDRTAYILDHTKENPLPALIRAGRSLREQGADFLAIPCITAHYFHSELSRHIGLPIVYLPGRTADELAEAGVSCVGVLATSGTLESGIFVEPFDRRGIRMCVPDARDQAAVMEIIYGQIKAGEPVDVDLFLEVGERLKEKGARKLILGCTELSLLKRDFPDRLGEDYVDVLEVLARAAITWGSTSEKTEAS